MKKIIFLCCSMLLLSCTSEPEVENKPEEKSVGDASAERGGDGKDDLLGYGYDVTREYANASSARFKIIDVDKFKGALVDQYYEEFPWSQTFKEEFGENAKAFSLKLSSSTTSTANFFFFSISRTTTNTNTNNFDSRFIYGKYSLVVKQKRLRLDSSPSELSANYLTNTFKQDILSKTPEQIVTDYGTHVLLDIYTGARLDMLFQSETINTDKSSASRSGLKASVLGIFNVTTNNEVGIADDKKNYAKKLFYNTRGGDVNKQLNGEVNLEDKRVLLPIINFSSWQNSSTQANSVLVDFGKTGLSLIYNFVTDPAKKQALKTYVDQYLIANSVNLFTTPTPTIVTNPFGIVNGNLVRNSSTNKYFLLFEGKLRSLNESNTNPISNQMLGVGVIKSLTPTELTFCVMGEPLNPIRNLIKTPDGAFYFREGNTLRWISTPVVFTKYVFNANAAVNVPNLNGFIVGKPIVN